MLKLYDYFRSSACYRVRIALNIKGLDHELIPVHLVNQSGEQFSENYQRINPQSLVPSLQENGEIITQSLAIIEYLNETHPTPPLLPKHPYERALVRSFALAIAADIHPLNNLRVLKYLTGELHLSEEKKLTWYHHWLSKGLQALEKKIISHNLSGHYCFGDIPTLADICLIPQMYNARRFECDLTPYPTLVKIDEYCRKQPAFIKAQPLETVSEVKG